MKNPEATPAGVIPAAPEQRAKVRERNYADGSIRYCLGSLRHDILDRIKGRSNKEDFLDDISYSYGERQGEPDRSIEEKQKEYLRHVSSLVGAIDERFLEAVDPGPAFKQLREKYEKRIKESERKAEENEKNREESHKEILNAKNVLNILKEEELEMLKAFALFNAPEKLARIQTSGRELIRLIELFFAESDPKKESFQEQRAEESFQKLKAFSNEFHVFLKSLPKNRFEIEGSLFSVLVQLLNE